MVKFKDVIYYNPEKGNKVYIADMKNKHIFHVPMRYAKECEILQFGCERDVVNAQMLRFFEEKGFVVES